MYKNWIIGGTVSSSVVVLAIISVVVRRYCYPEIQHPVQVVDNPEQEEEERRQEQQPLLA